MGYKNWKNIEYFVELHIGRLLHDNLLYEAPQKLIALSILEKQDMEYNFIDPIYREESKRL